MTKRRKKKDAKSDKERGLYRKYVVTRVDGSSEPGRKHEKCDYFVLDLTHDPFALHAIAAYVHACEKEYPALAEDLRKKVAVMVRDELKRSLKKSS